MKWPFIRLNWFWNERVHRDQGRYPIWNEKKLCFAVFDADEENEEGDVTWASASSLKALTRESSFSFSSAHWEGRWGGRGGEDRVRIPGVCMDHWSKSGGQTSAASCMSVLVCTPKCVFNQQLCCRDVWVAAVWKVGHTLRCFFL